MLKLSLSATLARSTGSCLTDKENRRTESIDQPIRKIPKPYQSCEKLISFAVYSGSSAANTALPRSGPATTGSWFASTTVLTAPFNARIMTPMARDLRAPHRASVSRGLAVECGDKWNDGFAMTLVLSFVADGRLNNETCVMMTLLLVLPATSYAESRGGSVRTTRKPILLDDESGVLELRAATR
jgi:hypothetical protein